MSFVAESIVAGATVVLAGVTGVLAWNTRTVAKVTREVGMESDRQKMRPYLIFEKPQPLSDGRGKYLRFSVMNKGVGQAKILSATTNVDGKQLVIEQHSLGNVVDVKTPFYWDIFGVELDDIVNIEIAYSDLNDRPYVDSEIYLQSQMTTPRSTRQNFLCGVADVVATSEGPPVAMLGAPNRSLRNIHFPSLGCFPIRPKGVWC